MNVAVTKNWYVPKEELLTVFTVNFLEAVEPEPNSENAINTGHSPPLER